MILNYTLRGGLTIPDGTTLSENEQEFILPCGTVCKLWEAVEIPDQDRDLNETGRNELGIYTDCNFDRQMELLDD